MGVLCIAYANRCRRLYRDEDGGVKRRPASTSTDDTLPKGRASWARLLRMVFEVDPLTCARCGAEMKVIALITQPVLIDRLLRHARKAGVEAKGERFDARAPPAA